jgi:beta-lactamase superfamily II metal-dependent hydrolase
MPPYTIADDDLVIHILNVGFGDNIILQFPNDANGNRPYAIVDCFKADKTIDYLDKLTGGVANGFYMDFICATHPHRDHILGIESLLRHPLYRPRRFWDSGFRHNLEKYRHIITALRDENIPMVRVSSGFEEYRGNVRLTVLAPSVMMRNRFGTYGVDMNNASIVLRLEHHSTPTLDIKYEEFTGNVSKEAIRRAGQSIAILAGDAEFDSWARITQEYPKLERQKKHKPLVTKMFNYLSCGVLKVAHHGSMHSSPLDVYEKMSPNLAIISTKQDTSTKGGITRNMFPHDSALVALEECEARVITTDGSFEEMLKADGTENDPQMAHEGSIIIAIPPGGKPRWRKLDDKKNDPAVPPQTLDQEL